MSVPLEGFPVLPRRPQPPTISERELQKAIVDTCKLLGYRVQHARGAWSSKGFRTPIQGHAGFPDLVICGHGRLLVRELKVGRNVLSEEQAAWIRALEAAGVDVGVWTEHDWTEGRIAAELRQGASVREVA